MSSCFLDCIKDNSINGIYDTLKNCTVISKYAGGIAMSVYNVRASQSYIRGTNGTFNGIVPMLRVFKNTARYVDQGGGKRKGSIAAYIEPWHAEVFAFSARARARDLFYALWIPDLFMDATDAAARAGRRRRRRRRSSPRRTQLARFAADVQHSTQVVGTACGPR